MMMNRIMGRVGRIGIFIGVSMLAFIACLAAICKMILKTILPIAAVCGIGYIVYTMTR